MNAMPQVAGMTVYCTDCTDPGLYVSDGSSYAAVGGSGGGGATVAADCDTNGFVGSMIGGVALSGASFSVTITNNSFGDVTLAFQNSDVALSGTAVGSVTVSSTSPASSTLSAGGSTIVTYNLTGTPTAGTLQADWSKVSLNCTKSRIVANGDATFTNAKNNKYIFSVNDAALPLDSQGTFISGTTLNIPYTSGQGSYGSYTSPEAPIDAQYAEDGASDWTFSYSYTGATFSGSGDIVATLVTKKAGVDTDFPAKRVSDITTINFDFVNLPLIIDGVTKPNTVGLDEGGDAIRGSLSTNGAAYDAATVNTPVEITYAEYQNMLNIIPGSEINGWTGSVTNNAINYGGATGQSSASHSTFTIPPANSYIAGVARAQYAGTASFVITVSANNTGQSGSNVCLTDPGATYTSLQSAFHYFAIKRPTTNSGASTGTLGHRATVNIPLSYVGTANAGAATYGYGVLGCGQNTNYLSPYTAALQVVTSTQKSW